MLKSERLRGASPKILLLFLLLVIIFFSSFLLGRYSITPDKVLSILISRIISIPKSWTDTMETVVLQVRFPRILAALLVGGALSVSGAAYQSIFKNPLVSPAILGVSAGAGFGAALGMIMHLPWIAVQVMAFLFALLAVAISFLISKIFGGSSMIVLVLGGMVISALFQALLSVAKYLADPLDTLPAITFWLMGGLSKVSNSDVLFVLFPITISIAGLYLIRWQVNVLTVGEEEAVALGVNINRIRLLVVICATLMTAAAVSISGIIGWVGLLVPHMARMIIGPNFQLLLPASLLMGSGYLLLVDNIGRNASSVEIPLGILTALIGAPFFVFLLSKVRKGWS
ncbi:FecCD family ABC transporter permease [Pelotomaculum propionicicum]|uniref:Putative ABC transporter permease protein n=1 Tax=Pelotomaculum propionicicum TaxID=258475 RepID=A0A4Y7RRD5_9FIRM|nr:iron ABC transporter permease [Pelotomaculum propionicicum]NLI14406.1 iron ABC transporter permease [Peptococcaceae bacterium]TEB11433.1 putative ABC transporter permease protein [Pelotomaculum propionicicum]